MKKRVKCEDLDLFRLGQEMKKIRKVCGWTQVDIAESVGMSQGAWSKIENGSLELCLKHWIKFCRQTKTDIGLCQKFLG